MTVEKLIALLRLQDPKRVVVIDDERCGECPPRVYTSEEYYSEYSPMRNNERVILSVS